MSTVDFELEDGATETITVAGDVNIGANNDASLRKGSGRMVGSASAVLSSHCMMRRQSVWISWGRTAGRIPNPIMSLTVLAGLGDRSSLKFSSRMRSIEMLRSPFTAFRHASAPTGSIGILPNHA